jgi:hypothetical protein
MRRQGKSGSLLLFAQVGMDTKHRCILHSHINRRLIQFIAKSDTFYALVSADLIRITHCQ